MTNSNQVSAAIKAGGTVVAPSRQRAAAIRLAASGAALRDGLGVWRTTDSIPWVGWLSRELDAARHRLPEGQRLLRPTEAWLIWRDIAEELATARGLVGSAGLASALPRALSGVRDWGLRWSGDPGPEAELLRAARGIWQQRCSGLGAVDASDWEVLASLSRPAAASPLMLAGFGNMGSALASWLGASGAVTINSRAVAPAIAQVHVAADGAAELDAAAAWCHARLAADPAARLLVVVPAMDRLRPRLLRSFSRALHPLLSGTPAEMAFALEGGQPLADFPLVASALLLLALGTRPLPFGEFSALLRSPYLNLGMPQAACQLDLWLRDRNVTAVDLPGLRRLLGSVTRELGTAATAMVQRLLDAVPPASGSDYTGTWARRFAMHLQTTGWPGSAPLASDELQVRRRFDELLGDYAASGTGLLRLERGAALQAIEALARETAFEPATDDVPVTITARLDDPVVHYDGIWVCGLDATRFPGPPAPDAFIPLAAQLVAGIPEASAEGQLMLARRALEAWQASTPELVLSYAAVEEDADMAPSGLLTGLQPWRPAPAGRAGIRAAPLESMDDSAGPPWREGRRVSGGVRTLRWQAECPFRAFAELRLAAAPLPEPAPGVDARLRGRVLHRALESLWRDLGDSTALLALSLAQQQARVEGTVRAALAMELAACGAELPALLVRAEERRSGTVVGMLLDAERQRAPFRVVQIEAQRTLLLGELAMRLRLDRVDVLADGNVAILDYKTGRAESFDPHAERLRHPQLPCYALAWDGAVVAVATVHLRRDGVRWRGASDTDGRLPQLHAAATGPGGWLALQGHWRTRLASLLQEFAAGVASVTPLPGACEHCHLAGVCRIEAAQQVIASVEAVDED